MERLEEILEWAKKSIQSYNESEVGGCYIYELGESNCKTGRMSIVIGDGHEEGGEWFPHAKLAYNCSALQCDYWLDWEMPYNEGTNEVDDTDGDADLSHVEWLVEYWEKNYKA